MKDLEKRLEEMEGRHSGLSKSYDSLQQEYLEVKAELDLLRKEYSRLEKERKGSDATSSSEWGQSPEPGCDPVLFQSLDGWSNDYGEGYRQQ